MNRHKRLQVKKYEISLENLRNVKFSDLEVLRDDLFAIFVKLSYLGQDGVPCYTCPSFLPIDQIQLGHCVTRKALELRWDMINCKPQCSHCNIDLKGNIRVFKARIEKETGKLSQLELIERTYQHRAYKIDRIDHIESIIKLRDECGKLRASKLKTLEAFGNSNWNSTLW